MLLGIPVKTRHNEVAPNQFEFAPILKKQLSSRSQLSVDGCYGKVAERHDLKCCSMKTFQRSKWFREA
jgi:glutamine synthetase